MIRFFRSLDVFHYNNDHDDDDDNDDIDDHSLPMPNAKTQAKHTQFSFVRSTFPFSVDRICGHIGKNPPHRQKPNIWTDTPNTGSVIRGARGIEMTVRDTQISRCAYAFRISMRFFMFCTYRDFFFLPYRLKNVLKTRGRDPQWKHQFFSPFVFVCVWGTCGVTSTAVCLFVMSRCVSNEEGTNVVQQVLRAEIKWGCIFYARVNESICVFSSSRCVFEGCVYTRV